MGPFLIIDKSSIQSLKLDEVFALEKHYSFIITPILITEIKANLAKKDVPVDELKSKISLLAKKANTLGSFTIDRHEILCHASLNGSKFGQRGQIPVFNAKSVIGPDGSHGIIVDESDESKTLTRWASGNFSEEEKAEAVEHYKDLEEYDLDGSKEHFAKLHPENTKFKSLEEIDTFYKERDYAGSPLTSNLIRMMTDQLKCTPEQRQDILDRWERENKPALSSFAPYAYHFARVHTIFWLGVTAGLIPTSKHAKSLIDFQYFFYSPFVHCFTSGDKFQRSFASVILDEEQDFIWAPDLKLDIGNIISCKSNMNDDDKKYYEINFGHYPPPMINSITNEMWKKHMNPWKPRSGNLASEKTDEENAKTWEYHNSLIKKSDK